MKNYNGEAVKAIKMEIASYEKQIQEEEEQRSRIYESARDDNRCLDPFEERDIMRCDAKLRELYLRIQDAIYRLYKCEGK